MKKIAIIGAGGFAKEALCCFQDALRLNSAELPSKFNFMVADAKIIGKTLMGVEVLPMGAIDPEVYKVLVAIGDPVKRKAVVENLPPEVEFTSVIHPTAVVSQWVTIGKGSIITAGTIITCDIEIGNHAHLNLHTTIGHDCIIGDYFTTTPAVNISGNCTFGEQVYIGTNASIRQGISICDNVVIGMGSVVLKSINEPGTYVGNPLRKL